MGWTCDVDELHTIDSKITFLAARNAVLNCDFPSGDCNDERDVSVISGGGINSSFFPYAYVDYDYYVYTGPYSTCPSEVNSLRRRLCYCKMR
jgi:hypothetical protein